MHTSLITSDPITNTHHVSEIPHVSRAPPGSSEHAKHISMLQEALVVEHISISASGRTVVVVGRGQEVGDFEMIVHISPTTVDAAATAGSATGAATDSSSGWSDCGLAISPAPHHCVLSLSYAAHAHTDAASTAKQLAAEHSHLPAHAAALYPPAVPLRRDRNGGTEGGQEEEEEEEEDDEVHDYDFDEDVSKPRKRRQQQRSRRMVERGGGGGGGEGGDRGGQQQQQQQQNGHSMFATSGTGELSNGVQAGSSFVAVQARAPTGRSFQIDVIMRQRTHTEVGGGVVEASHQVCFSQEQLCHTDTDTDTGTGGSKPTPAKILSVPQELAHIQRVRSAVDEIFLQRSKEFHSNFMKRLQLTESAASASASANAGSEAAADGEADAWINDDGDIISPPPASATSPSARRVFTAADIKAGKAALSSLLGGIGHFRGVPQVGDAGSLDHHIDGDRAGGRGDAPAPVAPQYISLLSCTPSRTAFPRGFLWDEGELELCLWGLQRIVSKRFN